VRDIHYFTCLGHLGQRDPNRNDPNGLFTLAKFAKKNCWRQRHVTVITVLALATLGDVTRNRNNPICVASPKVAKASK